MYEKILVNTESKLEQLKDELSNSPIFGYDTETNGTFDRFKMALVGMSFAANKERAYYVPINHLEGEQLLLDQVLEAVKPALLNEKVEKVCHNAKFDETVMRKYKVFVQGKGHDTFIMNWMLSESAGGKGSRSLKPLVFNHLGYKMKTYEEVVEAAPKKRGEVRDYNFAKVLLDDAVEYAADDAYWVLMLFFHYKKELEKQSIWKPYYHLECPFNRVLVALEEKGVKIDMDAIAYADKRLPAIVEQVDSDIYEQAGEVFNIGSGKQLGPILFEKLKIGNNVPKTNSGLYKTDKKTLELYAAKHKIVEDVLRRKKITKTHSTFVEGIANFISPDNRLHAGFNGCGTVTGRLSSSKPNLQNIEGDEVEEIKVRNFFVPTDGHRFVVADYSQIELRIIAHFSRDERMTAAFMQGDEDFHEAVAREVFEVPDGEKVTRRQRVIAKTINFGIGYGRGGASIAELLDIPVYQGKQYVEDWFEKFNGVRAYKNYLIAKAKEVEYIRTISGRKRRLPDINSKVWKIKGRAERQAMNTKIQGSAADIIKAAMNVMDEPLRELNSQMVIQIHDELVIDTPTDKVDEVVGIVKQIMENPINGKNPLRLPLVVDPLVVDRWGDAK